MQRDVKADEIGLEVFHELEHAFFVVDSAQVLGEAVVDDLDFSDWCLMGKIWLPSRLHFRHHSRKSAVSDLKQAAKKHLK